MNDDCNHGKDDYSDIHEPCIKSKCIKFKSILNLFS